MLGGREAKAKEEAEKQRVRLGRRKQHIQKMTQ
jgi:hypothetical protein